MLKTADPPETAEDVNDWIDATRASALGGFTTRTLNTLRKRGDGPPEYKITDRCIRYRESEVREWLETRRNQRKAG